VFQCFAITQQQIEALLTLDAETQRKEVIALVTRLPFPEAWKQITGQDIDLTATTKEVKQEKAKAKQEKAPELTDDDWFDTYCSEKAKCLQADHGKYKADALLYRRITEARAKFRAAVKGALAEQKATGHVGLLWMAVNRVISLTHPKDFFICEDCNGTGVVNEEPCNKCRGGGYLLRTEKYL